MIAAARSVGATLLAIGVIAALVALCSGCALGAKSSTVGESHETLRTATESQTDRQVVATRERGAVVETTKTPVVVSVNGQERLVYASKRKRWGPARSALASNTKTAGGTVVEQGQWAKWNAWASSRFGPSWGANLAMAGAGLAALAGLVRYGPALWNFVKGKVGL